jgi:NADH:ubiquinone oxidoreductase subunit 6 (subunit J)
MPNITLSQATFLLGVAVLAFLLKKGFQLLKFILIQVFWSALAVLILAWVLYPDEFHRHWQQFCDFVGLSRISQLIGMLLNLLQVSKDVTAPQEGWGQLLGDMFRRGYRMYFQ